MRAFLMFLVLGVLGGGPAAAQTPTTTLESVRQSIDAQDFSAIETTLAQAHRTALESGDFAELRKIYGRIFQTANGKRLAATEQWAAAHPRSPYALTALVWAHLDRAFGYRGTDSIRFTSREAVAGFTAEISEAEKLVDRALELGPDFLPAHDAKLLLTAYGRQSGSTLAALDASFAIRADRHSLSLARHALAQRWNGLYEDNIALCEKYAPRIEGYDRDLCMAEFVFENRIEDEGRRWALEVLDRHDEAFLDEYRLDALVEEWADRPRAREEAIRIHRKLLEDDPGPSGYQRQLDLIRYRFGVPDYGVEATEALRKSLLSRLEDGPEEPEILEWLIRDLIRQVRFESRRIDTEETAQVEQWWDGFMVLGKYQPTAWELRNTIDAFVSMDVDLDRALRNTGNAIYYSNHDPARIEAFRSYLYDLYRNAERQSASPPGKGPDPSLLQAATICPMFRMQRLLDAVCEMSPENYGCQIANTVGDASQRIRTMVGTSQDCEYERAAPLENLVFVPVLPDTGTADQ